MVVSNTQAQKPVPYQISSSQYSIALPGSLSLYPESSTEQPAHHATGKESTEGGRSRMAIDMLPDVALLRVFDFYMDETERIEYWHTLVHVCRNWRYIVFQSPRRLGLQLQCTCKTLVRERLDVWPPLPIVLSYSVHKMWDRSNTNILAALEHTDRICGFDMYLVPRRQLENILAAMQQPFPALTHLYLRPDGVTPPIIPDSFLSGSAPRLRTIYLDGVSFPGLHRNCFCLQLTSSFSLLSEFLIWGTFHLRRWPCGQSSLIGLERPRLQFRSPRSRPDQERRPPPPPTRPQLPVLTHFKFTGVSEYLEDLVVRIDAPLLNMLDHNLLSSIRIRHFTARSVH